VRVPALVAWLLAAGSVALAAVGFTQGRSLGPAALGYPGVAAAFFFVLLARVASLPAPAVARLGAWPLYAGGAAVCVALALGATSLVTRGLSGPALPLMVLGSPLVAVASLRLSTGVPRPRALQATAMALLLLAAAATLELVRVWPALGLPGR
jgi:hypothetical protein